MKSLLVERTIKVPLDKVWAAVDFTKAQGPYPVVMVKDGDPSRNGVGSQRIITFGKRRVVESLESIDPPHSYTYAIISGSPVKYYLGKAEFVSKGEFTEIRWSGEFTPKIPGIGWIIIKTTKKIVNTLIDDIEKTTKQ